MTELQQLAKWYDELAPNGWYDKFPNKDNYAHGQIIYPEFSDTGISIIYPDCKLEIYPIHHYYYGSISIKLKTNDWRYSFHFRGNNIQQLINVLTKLSPNLIEAYYLTIKMGLLKILLPCDWWFAYALT